MSFSVDYWDCEAPVSRWNEDGFKGVRKVKTAWGDAGTFCAEVLSSNNAFWPYDDGGAGYAISALMTAWPNAKMTSAGSGLVQFEDALITVDYSSRTFEYNLNGEKVLGYEKAATGLSSEPINPDGLFWESENGPPVEMSEAPPFDVPYLNYVIGLIGVSYIPDAVFSFRGACNSKPFPTFSMGKTFAVETLRYIGPTQLAQTYTTKGAQGWKIELSFMHNPLGWNNFWRPSSMAYQSIYNSEGTQYKPRTPLDLRMLFV